jgi:hypothetical protein
LNEEEMLNKGCSNLPLFLLGLATPILLGLEPRVLKLEKPMDDDFTLPNHLFISLKKQFQATRVVDRQITPVTIDIKVDLSVDGQDDDDYGERQAIALDKITYFVENILNESVMISGENQWAMESFIDGQDVVTNNSLVVCPEDPEDAMLGELILSKFKALSQNAFQFHSIEIQASDGRGMSFTFIGSTPGEEFPVLDSENWFSKPWWNRDDASAMDLTPPTGWDRNKPPRWAFSLAFLAERTQVEKEDHEVVVRPEFRPRIIQGGKDTSGPE